MPGAFETSVFLSPMILCFFCFEAFLYSVFGLFCSRIEIKVFFPGTQIVTICTILSPGSLVTNTILGIRICYSWAATRIRVVNYSDILQKLDVPKANSEKCVNSLVQNKRTEIQ